jgi:hypothetical protein
MGTTCEQRLLQNGIDIEDVVAAFMQVISQLQRFDDGKWERGDGSHVSALRMCCHEITRQREKEIKQLYKKIKHAYKA